MYTNNLEIVYNVYIMTSNTPVINNNYKNYSINNTLINIIDSDSDNDNDDISISSDDSYGVVNDKKKTINHKSKYNNILNELRDYMFTSKLLRDKTRNINNNIIVKESKKKTYKYHRSLFVPDKGDTLFWIFYSIVNGIDMYELIGNNYFITEKNEKIKYIDIIKQNKDKIREYKIKKISSCEDDLINNECISLKTFHMLCICHDIDFMFIKNRTYYIHKMDIEEEIENKYVNNSIINNYIDNEPYDNVDNDDSDDDNEEYKKYQKIDWDKENCLLDVNNKIINEKREQVIMKNIYVIHQLENNNYGCEFKIYKEVFENYKQTRLKIMNYDKPIKSMTSYSLNELKDICNTLHIKIERNQGKNKTKTELYTDIISYIDV